MEKKRVGGKLFSILFLVFSKNSKIYFKTFFYISILLIMTSFSVSQISQIENLRVLMEKGDKSFTQKDWGSAVRYYTHSLEIWVEKDGLDKKIDLYYCRGKAYLYKLDYVKAIDDFSIVLKLNPKITEIYHRRGDAYKGIKKYDLAIKDYNKVIKLEPKYSEIFWVYYGRGISYAHTNNYPLAFEDFNKTIQFAPTFASVYRFRGLYYKDINEYEKAMKDFNKAIELEIKDSEIFNDRGSLFYLTKEYKNAIKDFSKFIQLSPRNWEGYINRGTVYSEIGNYNKAIIDFSKAIELDPHQSISFFKRSRILYHEGRHDEALEDIGKAINLKSDGADYYQLRSDIYFWGRGDYAKSTENLELAINTLSKLPATEDKRKFLNQRLIYRFYYAGEYDKALFKIKRIGLNDDLIILRDHVLVDKGEYKKVIDDMEALIRKKCFNPPIYFNMTKAYYELNDLEKAEFNAKKSIESNPSDSIALVTAYDYLLRIYKETKKSDEYKKIFELSTKLVSKEIKEDTAKKWYWQKQLVDLLSTQDIITDKLIDIAQDVVKHRPAWDSFLTLGYIYLKIGNYNKAVQSFEKSLGLNPNNAWTWYYLGFARKGRNQISAAKYAWEQGLKINPNHRFIKEELKKIK